MASAKLIEKAKRDFANYLKKVNLRSTEQRYEVLNAIFEIDGHFGAEDLFIQMKNQGKKISRATVYNTLDILLLTFFLNSALYQDTKSGTLIFMKEP
jgi:Fur family ferric uptake transcriptional regulator